MSIAPAEGIAPTTGHQGGGPRLPYIPAVDGLRALAVLAVILYHAEFGLQGGFLGVDVFFVISGYLITSLLLAEWGQSGRVDFKGFWMRRARRLLPAVYLLLICVLAYSVLFLPDEVASLRSDAAASATYVTNWYLIFANKSYFEAVGRPSLLRHLWSLAVEEQFYLLWPLLFFGAMSFLRRPRYILAALIAGIVGSTVLMAALYDPQIDPSRVYYGTDTRAAALLVGVALAFVWAPGQPHTRAGQRLLDGVGMVSLLGLFVACAWLDEFQPFLYRGGFLLVALLTATLVAVSVHPRARWVPWLLSTPPLRWVGLRSYGIYLWHWPVLMVTRPQLDVAFDGLPLFVFRLVLTLVLADLSYRFVEMPIRRGALERAWRTYRESSGEQRRRLGFTWTACLAGMLVFFTVLGQSVVKAQPPPPPPYLAVESINTLAAAGQEEVAAPSPAGQSRNPAGTTPPGAGDTPVTVGPSTNSLPVPARLAILVRRAPGIWSLSVLLDAMPRPRPAPSQAIARAPGTLPPANSLAEDIRPRPHPVLPATPTVTATATLTATEAVSGTLPLASTSPLETPPATPITPTATVRPPGAWGPDHISMFGDSVMLGAAQYGTLQSTFGDVDIDARIGRQVSTAIQLLQARRAAARLGPIVVLHVGDNGTFTPEQFDQIIDILSDRRHVFFLTIKVPQRAWEAPNNAVLEEGVKRHPANVTLIDWRGATLQHPELFWGDGMHLRPEGAQLYAQMIQDAIKAFEQQQATATPQPQ